jgi:hypothetical protein
MSRPKPLSKTKLLRRQLREAEQKAQTRYDAINRVASDKQRQLEEARQKLQNIGFTEVYLQEPHREVYQVAIRVDRRAIGHLKFPGHFLADLAGELFTKLVREMPELSGAAPKDFFGRLRTLPAAERNAKLHPFWDALRRKVFDDYQKSVLENGGRFSTDANAVELQEVFQRDLSFLSSWNSSKNTPTSSTRNPLP